MLSIHRTVNVATLVTDIRLHDTGTPGLGTCHLLWVLFRSERDIHTATAASSVNNKLFMVLLEANFEPHLAHRLFPFVKLFQHFQKRGPMSTHHYSRPFTQYSPSTLILVGKQLLDFLCHGVGFIFLLCFGKEKAIYTVPEMP